VGPRAGLEVMAKIKILPRRGPNPGLPAQHQSRYRATIPTLKVEQTWSVANNVTMSTRNERRVSISVNEIYSVTLLLSELSFNTPLSNLVIHCDTTGCSCSFRSWKDRVNMKRTVIAYSVRTQTWSTPPLLA